FKEAPVPASSAPESTPAAKRSEPRPLRVALFGFGTVGRSAARILIESAPAGLELTHIFNRGIDRKRVDWVPSTVTWTDDADSVFTSKDAPDILVELAGGLDPA